MKSKAAPPLSRQISPDRYLWFTSVLAGLTVFATVIFLQWLIYDDWMHRGGPLRLVGSALAAVLTGLLTFRWQSVVRKRKIEILHRFETIRWMNDRIRNSLQAIECVIYASHPQMTDSVRDAVDAIEEVLRGVLEETHLSTEEISEEIISKYKSLERPL